MAINTYSSLQTAITSWLFGRTDLAAQIPDFITLCEQRLYYGDGAFEPLRIRFMETVATLSTIGGQPYLPLPSDFLQARSAYLATGPRVPVNNALEYRSPANLFTSYTTSYSGRPKFFTIEGNNIYFGPIPDGVYSISFCYYALPQPLSSTSTNWLITNAPGVYLYGSLAEAAPYIEDSRTGLWETKFVSLVNGLRVSDELDRFGPTPLRSVTDTGNP